MDYSIENQFIRVTKAGGRPHLGEDRRRCIAVSSEGFVELVQFLQHRFLVLILPQWPVSDQPAVVIHRAAENRGGHPVFLRLLGFHCETLRRHITWLLVWLKDVHKKDFIDTERPKLSSQKSDSRERTVDTKK